MSNRWTLAELVARGIVSSDAVPALRRSDVVKRERPRDFEEQAQAYVVEQFGIRYPHLARLLIHIPNGGSRANKFEGYRLKRLGVRAGTSDLWFMHRRGGFAGLVIEMKADPPLDSPVSEAQLRFLADAWEQGMATRVCRGAAVALQALDEYLALPADDLRALDPVWQTRTAVSFSAGSPSAGKLRRSALRGAPARRRRPQRSSAN